MTRPDKSMRPADLRKAVKEWVSIGCAVKIGPDGTIEVTPPTHEHGDDFDMIDMKAP